VSCILQQVKSYCPHCSRIAAGLCTKEGALNPQLLMKHTYCCITLVEHEMKSTVTHTSQKLSGDMNSAHTPAGVSPKKASIFCQRREREREITFGEEFGALPGKNLKKIQKLCFKINLTPKAAGRKIEKGMACSQRSSEVQHNEASETIAKFFLVPFFLSSTGRIFPRLQQRRNRQT
jgi:hypothetical protein